MRQRIRSLITGLTLAQRFKLASFVILILGLVGIGVWVQRQIESAIIRSTAATTALYVESFVEPQLGDVVEGQPISRQNRWFLSQLLKDTPLRRQIVAFKLWGPDGRVLYDTDPNMIGQVFPVEPRLAQAWKGETTSRVSSLESEENISERPLADRLLETYSPVHAGASDRIIAVAEFYQKVDEMQADIATAQRLSWVVVAGAMLLIYVLLSGFVDRASDTIRLQQSELTAQVERLKELLAQNAQLSERVRRGAAETAAVNERFLRRISAELHDGPAQYLSLALLRLDPGDGVEEWRSGGEDGLDERAGQAGRAAEGRAAEDRLGVIRDAVSHALQEIRTVSAGLGLPELDRVTLAEAISRAVRGHERRTGSRVTLGIEDIPAEAPLAVKITAYRVIQEALNNAYRHAGGAGQEVRARSSNNELLLEIWDRGPGFAAAEAFEGEGHLGLLGMRERVQSLGGDFRVESRPGEGTTVTACLALGAPEAIYGG